MAYHPTDTSTAPNELEAEERVNPVDLFLHAAGFEVAADVIGRDMFNAITNHAQTGGATGIPTYIASGVVTSFCTELYLKCLIQLDRGGDPPRGHDLEKLFGMLSQHRQGRVIALFQAIVSNAPADFTNLATGEDAPLPADHWDFWRILRSGARSFEKWRYAFERPTEALGANPWLIRIAVRQAVTEMNPECLDLVGRMGIPPTWPPR